MSSLVEVLQLEELVEKLQSQFVLTVGWETINVAWARDKVVVSFLGVQLLFNLISRFLFYLFLSFILKVIRPWILSRVVGESPLINCIAQSLGTRPICFECLVWISNMFRHVAAAVLWGVSNDATRALSVLFCFVLSYGCQCWLFCSCHYRGSTCSGQNSRKIDGQSAYWRIKAWVSAFDARLLRQCPQIVPFCVFLSLDLLFLTLFMLTRWKIAWYCNWMMLRSLFHHASVTGQLKIPQPVEVSVNIISLCSPLSHPWSR